MENLQKENYDDTKGIRILATDDDKIKELGVLLASDSSREILNLLFNGEMAASGIASKTGMSIELVRHHLQKMQKIGLIEISAIKKNSKEQDMKYYVSKKFIIMVLPPPISEKAKKSKSLLTSLKKIYYFTGVGIAAVSSWLVTLYITSPKITLDRPSGISGIPDSMFWSTIVLLSIIVIGLIVERILIRKK